MSLGLEKIAFIVNPKSGTKDKSQISRFIERCLDKNIFEYEIYYTNAKNHASEITEDLLSKGIKKIVAVGGDGTVNEIAKMLVNTDATLGIIPVGSGNGLARHLKVPLRIPQAINLINKSKTAEIDVGCVNGHYFFCTAGVGYDAHISHTFASGRKRGFKTYIKTILSEYSKYQSEIYLLNSTEEEGEVKAFSITVGNTAQFGNNAYICPYADVQDGVLDVSIILPFSLHGVFDVPLKIFARRIHKSKYSKLFKTSALTIERQASGYVNIDGEAIEMGREVRFTVLPLSLKVIVGNDNS